jgi:3-phosphoglycerate kinase
LNIGRSLCEDDFLSEAKGLLGNPKFYMPQDVVIAREIKPGQKVGTVDVSNIPSDAIGVDIGERSISDIKSLVQKAKTIVWNGPMGVFEIDDFAKGTEEIAKAIAEVTDKGAISIVGGGDTVAALEKFNLKSRMSHVSTGGGASLEFLEGKELPGVKVLKEK